TSTVGSPAVGCGRRPPSGRRGGAVGGGRFAGVAGGGGDGGGGGCGRCPVAGGVAAGRAAGRVVDDERRPAGDQRDDHVPHLAAGLVLVALAVDAEGVPGRRPGDDVEGVEQAPAAVAAVAGAPVGGGRQLGCEAGGDLGAQGLAAVGHRLLDGGREGLLQLGGAADAAGELVEAHPAVEEAVEAFAERALGDERRELGEQALGVALPGGDEQRLEVVEVDVERAERDAGLGGDVPGGGPEHAPVVQGEERVDDGLSRARRTRDATVATGTAH